MHQLTAVAPQLAIQQKQRAQVVREQLGRHEKRLAARVQSTTLVYEVVRNVLRRHHDVGSVGDTESEDRPILVDQRFELEPGVVGRDVKEVPNDWLLCSIMNA
jgi:hypothetical protein